MRLPALLAHRYALSSLFFFLVFHIFIFYLFMRFLCCFTDTILLFESIGQFFFSPFLSVTFLSVSISIWGIIVILLFFFIMSTVCIRQGCTFWSEKSTYIRRKANFLKNIGIEIIG